MFAWPVEHKLKLTYKAIAIECQCAMIWMCAVRNVRPHICVFYANNFVPSFSHPFAHSVGVFSRHMAMRKHIVKLKV